MNAEEAIEQIDRRAVVEKLEELARASGVEGAYAVDRAPDGRVHSVVLLDEDRGCPAARRPSQRDVVRPRLGPEP